MLFYFPSGLCGDDDNGGDDSGKSWVVDFGRERGSLVYTVDFGIKSTKNG